ncbi:MAG: hypothetical protein ACREKR_03845 [Candidatus Methylomirabilales bacterium]
MGRTTQYWLIAAFMAGFVAVGFPYWQIPYNKVSLPDALMGPSLFVVGIAALLVRAFGVARFVKTIMVAGAAVPAAVLARVIVDGLKDPTSHNLWPLEVIIALVVGFVCALAGAIAGGLVTSLFAWYTGVRQS